MELGPFSKLLLTGYYSKPYCLNIIFLKAQVVKGKNTVADEIKCCHLFSNFHTCNNEHSYKTNQQAVNN